MKMKLHYYPETDSLYIELMEKPGVATFEIREGLNVDVDADDNVVGFDIDHLPTLIAAVGPDAEQEKWRLSRFAADADYAGGHNIGGYLRVFDAAATGGGIHRYIDAFSGIANPRVPAPIPSAVSLTFDDSALMLGAGQDAFTNF